ncbi:MAG TPA: hypothetical protein VHY22_05820 [Chthoniobacteraceae bacterium]|jgi:hypothetical protein|nr:hypothetical protein [Chthoniobacteraceae bacterium]
MRLPSSAALILMVCALPALAEKPDEAALQTLWDNQQKETHAQVVQEAAGFEQRFPASPLVAVARGLGAWHLLESGDFDAARQLLEKMRASGGANPAGAMGAEMARRWLTRLDREQVASALQAVYAEDLEYPETLAPLAELPPEKRPPMTDRWGAAWLYKPAAFKKLQIGDRQTYILQSATLGDDSDLKHALARSYGAGFTFKPVAALPEIGGKAVFAFQDASGRRVTVSEGASGSDLGLAYLGDTVLILSNGDYWSLQPRPSS